jgi:hypothetical protein
MVDYSKLNKHKWCGCCSPEQMFKAAEEILEAAAQKHYTKPMCLISMAHTMAIASFMYGGAGSNVVGKMMTDETGLPEEFAHNFAQDSFIQAEATIMEDVAKFLTDEYPNFVKEFIAKHNAIKELRKADEAFNAAPKDT